MMVLFSAIFVFAFIVVLQFNHLLFDDRPPKIMNPGDFEVEIKKIQQKRRDRSRSNQVSPSTSETPVSPSSTSEAFVYRAVVSMR